MLVATDRSWERGILDDAIRLTDTALVETGDVTNRPDFGDYLGCCGGMCCCHRPDREEPGHCGIQPCDSRIPYVAMDLETFGTPGVTLFG